MKISFRQGIVRYDSPLFTVNPTTVSLVVTNQSVPIAFADGNQDYLWYEVNTIPNAWDPITPGVDQWLYWDLNLQTGVRTFGITLVRPIAGNTSPNQATTQVVAGVNLIGGAGSNYFEVVGNFTGAFPGGKELVISGSTNNNGTYVVVSTGSTYIPSSNITRIPVTTAIPSDLGTLGSVATPGLTIPVDQHWFDTQNKQMKVWNGTRWVKRVRVFACLLAGGSVPTSVSILSPTLFSGTQVGLTTPTDAGEIIFDSLSGKPLRRVDDTFVTAETKLTTPSVFASSVKLNALTVSAQAQEPFAAYMVVKFSNFGEIVHADQFTAGTEPFGIVLEDVDTNDFVNVFTGGSVSNPTWNWPTINQYVYVTSTGLLTLTPSFVNQVPVGIVIDKKTILFGVPPGFIGSSGSGSVTSVGIIPPASGIGVSGSPITSSGNITLSLTNDLAAVEGLSATGYAVRTAANTWTTRTITGTAGQVNVVNGDGVAGNTTLSLPNVGSSVSNQFVKITTDVQGRVSATTPVLAGDITPLIDSIYVNVSGDTMSGFLTLNANPTALLHAATKQYVDTADAAHVLKAGDTMSGFLTLNADPTALLHAATKQYVDTLAAGLHPKQAVRVATTANLPSLSGLLTIDGVTLLAGDRILVKDQISPVNNGIYVAAAGAWSRALDYDGTPSGEVQSGDFTFVEQGTINGSSSWIQIEPNPITVGVSNISFVLFNIVGSSPVTSVFGRTGAVVAVEGDYNLTQLGDVLITAPVLGQVLKYDGLQWVNGTDIAGGLTDPGVNGIVVRTALNATTSRSLDGVAGHIIVTNGSGVTGNPTIDLATVGTAGTHAQVTTDAYGRVVSGSSTQAWSTITGTPTTLTGYGITDAVRNALGTPSVTQDIFANRPTAGTAGRLFVDTTNNLIQRDTGSSWVTLSGGGGGTVTSVNAAGGSTGLTFTGGPITTSGTLTLGGTLATTNGGTGLTSIGTANQMLGVNTGGTALEYKTITAGTGITVTPSAGAITIAATGGSGLQRYSIGGGSYVLATGTGVTATIGGTSAVINGTSGVEIVSASLSVTPSGTTYDVDFGINEGMGDNGSYSTIYLPLVQVVNNVSGSRTVVGTPVPYGVNYNVNSHTFRVTGLTPGLPLFITIRF